MNVVGGMGEERRRSPPSRLIGPALEALAV